MLLSQHTSSLALFVRDAPSPPDWHGFSHRQFATTILTTPSWFALLACVALRSFCACWGIVIANCKRRPKGRRRRLSHWSGMARVVLALQKERRDMTKNAAQKPEAQKNLVQVITETFTQQEQVLRNGDWVNTDVMAFQRRIIFEALMDKLDWLIESPKGTNAYVAQTRERVAQAQKRYVGDEISTMFLKGAIAEAKAANLKHMALTDLMSQLEAAYIADNGDSYTPYGKTRRSNVRIDEPKDIPADIAAELAALGMTPDLGTTANTQGVEDTRDIA